MSFLDSLDVGGVGGLAGGLSGGGWKDMFGAEDAKDAAREQEQGYEEAGGIYEEAGRKALGRYLPYANTSQKANRMIDRAISGDYSDFEASPDYQFRLSEGQKALDRSAAGRGMLLSGAQLKDSQRFNQGLASTEYGNWFNRLRGLRGEGIGMAGQQAGIDMGTGQNVANAKLGAAGARASGYMVDANLENYLASSLHESGQRIGEAWATMGMGGGNGGMAGGGGLGGSSSMGAGGFNYGTPYAPASGGGTWYGPFAGG